MNVSETRAVAKLLAAQTRQRPGRHLLATLATVAAACVVVWVVSGYDSLAGRFGDMGGDYLGRYDLLVLPAVGRSGEADGGPAGPPAARLGDDLVAALRADPAVAAVDPAFETRVAIRPARGTPTPTNPAAPGPGIGQPETTITGARVTGGMAQTRGMGRSPTLVGTTAEAAPHPVAKGAWFDPGKPERREAAITADSAEALGVDLGDELVVAPGRGRPEARLRVAAILEQPKRLPPPRFMIGLPPSRDEALRGGPAAHAVYVPKALAEELSGGSARPSYAGVVLRDRGTSAGFLDRWADRFAHATPPAEARDLAAVAAEVAGSTTFETVRAQAYSATGVSLLAALFIIYTTLSMGVDERARQLAMLRAVALTRGQVALLVLLEGVGLGVVGWAGGLLAGWGLLALMARLRPDSLAEGAALGPWSVALAGACALGGAVGASVVPAWRATRVDPIAAMAGRSQSRSPRSAAILALAGLALVAVNPILVFFVPMPDAARYAASAAVGCTAMAVGFVLLAPLVVRLAEAAFGPILARLLGLSPRLLATQLSANLGRTVGTAVALTLGLGLFVAMQTWGYSMLAPFTPGDWCPDLVVSVGAGGLPGDKVEAIRHARGIDPDRFVPLALKQVKLADDPTGFRERPSATRQDTCVMVGVDPVAALGGDDPLFPFDFASGTRDGAIARLKEGRSCLVPDHFARESGLGVGDRFRVVPPARPDASAVEYEIAGVVSMPGWHWLTKSGGFRRGRAAGLMFASAESVRRDFDAGPPATFWADADGTATEGQIRAAVAAIVGKPGGAGRGPAVTVQSVAEARAEVRDRATGIIWALSELPLVTLAVAALGVLNTVIASIRSRRWELGILRALGTTRSALVRLILAEAILIGLVACVLSLGFGALAGYCGTGVTRYMNIRGGQVTPLVIPWANVLVGFAAALALCLLAALGPAIRAGRTEPLRLLQAGRSIT